MPKPSIFKASLLQLSGILGVGIFALPYLYYHSNLSFALFGLFWLFILTLFINFYYADIIHSTPHSHQFLGYARHYLHPTLANFLGLNLFLLIPCALFAFFQMGPVFLQQLFPYFSSTLSSVLFLVLVILLYLPHPLWLKKLLSFLPALFFLLPLFLFSAVLQTPIPSWEAPVSNLRFAGWTIFALTGFNILPEVRQLLGAKYTLSKLKLATFWGLFLATILYALYILATLYLVGPKISLNSALSLASFHPFLGQIVALVGVLSTSQASANFMRIFYHTLTSDLRLKAKQSHLISLIFPLTSPLLLSINIFKLVEVVATFTTVFTVYGILLIRRKLPTSLFHTFVMVLIFLTFLFALLSQLS